MSTEYLACKTKNTEPTQQYVNSAYKSDEADCTEMNSKLDHNNPNHFLGSERGEQKQRSPSINQSLPVLNKKNQSKRQMMKSLFRTKNTVSMYRSLVKRREEKAHILLYMIICIYVIMCICVKGLSPIMLSFVQRTYGWKANLYMRVESYGLLLGLISTFLLFCFHKIELNDTITVLIGLVGLFFFLFIRGVVLYPIGLYLSYLIGSINVCGLVACRGLTSKIIPEREIGTILGALSVLYAASPVLGSLMYSQTFNLTINLYIGTAFLTGSSLVAIGIGVCIWLFLRYKIYQAKMAEKKVIA